MRMLFLFVLILIQCFQIQSYTPWVEKLWQVFRIQVGDDLNSVIITGDKLSFQYDHHSHYARMKFMSFVMSQQDFNMGCILLRDSKS